MQFEIEILSVTSETKPGKVGTYTLIDVAFKNLSSGKTEGKKFYPFGNSSTAHKALKDANQGARFIVTSEKGEQYWEWVKVEAVAPGTPMPSPTEAAKGIPAPKSNYETSEERAQRQVAIAKQSSLKVAADLLIVGAKTPPSAQSVIDLAKVFTDWVLASPKAPASLDIKQRTLLSLADMPSDNLEEGVQ